MFAKVVVDISNDAVDKVFDYIALPNTQVGMRVKVPFGGRVLLGYVLSLSNSTNFEESKVKSIISNLEEVPKIKPEMLALVSFLAEKFFLRYSDCIKLVLPSCVRLDKQKQQHTYTCQLLTDLEEAINIVGRRAKNQLAVLSYLSEQGEVDFNNLVQMFGRQSVNSLIQKGLIIKNSYKHNRVPEFDLATNEKPTLTKMQKEAVNKILSANKTYLLHGVTGSGKTEVYMSVIQHCLDIGKTAIMLVPEISLTPLMMQRFNSRFPGKVAVLHSGLSEGEKFDEWNRIFCGEARVVLGARSAVFAPVENVGVIIIDEEHDNSYVSDNNPRYNTHDVAMFRAKYNNCPLILGSATPSLESYQKAINKDYELIQLPERINGIQMPKFEIVDMLSEVLDGNVSPYSKKLLNKLEECINAGKQAILFIVRRGYASFVMCKECGYRAKCDDCEVSLVYHQEDNELKCHFCGKRYRALTNCPNCNSKNIRYGALGTERVCADLKKLFPNVPIYRYDIDSTRGKNGHKKILSQFAASKPGILVGTQMIAKGHDFPNVMFVGILDADASLYNSDYKSNERTFQLITQVAGRAGRKNNDGHVILQTYAPKHYAYRMAANYDYKSFFDKEINLRKTTLFPPFSTILRILVTSEIDSKAIETTKKIYDKAQELKTKYGNRIYFLQAMPSPVKKLKKSFRYQIIARFETCNEIVCDFYSISDIIEKDVTIFVETNPNNLR